MDVALEPALVARHVGRIGGVLQSPANDGKEVSIAFMPSTEGDMPSSTAHRGLQDHKKVSKQHACTVQRDPPSPHTTHPPPFFPTLLFVHRTNTGVPGSRSSLRASAAGVATYLVRAYSCAAYCAVDRN